MVQNNETLLKKIRIHKNANYKIRKQVDNLLEKVHSQLESSEEMEILSNPINLNDENVFNVVKKSKSSMFIFFLMMKFNSEILKNPRFSDKDKKQFIDKFIMNIDIYPTFWFDNEMKMNDNKTKILAFIQSLHNNLSVLVRMDEYYNANNSTSYFIIQSEEAAISQSKRSFAAFMNTWICLLMVLVAHIK